MQFLILAILTSTAIIITFRVFERFRISIVQAITVNYIVATGFGFLSAPAVPAPEELIVQPWFLISLVIGLTLIVAFNLYALSAQHTGVAVTAISGRMSVVIPVLLGFILFDDKLNWMKMTGIIIGLVGFYLTFKKGHEQKTRLKYYWLPLLLFLAMGINDSTMKIAEHYFITGDFVVFLSACFGMAMILGIVMLILKSVKEKQVFAFKNFVAGIILGLLNWYSTLYFLKGIDVFEVSFFMPVYNIGVVALSALTGNFIFREKLSLYNWIGILFAIIAIMLISNS